MTSISISIASFCKACSIGRTKAYDLIASGDLEAVKIGRRTLVTQRSVDALIERGIAEAQRTWTR